jgi:tRNA nucleotidyltransferase (CCA-adding enzyme)
MTGVVPTDLARVLAETPELSRSYLVGGCVRDHLLGLPQKDFDIEVFGVSYELLVHALSKWGRTDLVGRSFGVVKLTTIQATYDFTIPRRDSKSGPGHKGFEVSFDPSITPEQAASRRDFTINSLMYYPREERLLDFFSGESDLRNRILRHTSPAFAEDPLRVLRGMQFCARFRLIAAPETLALCREMRASFRELPRERVREEWFKWASRSEVPSMGLLFLSQSGWIDFFPEIRALQGTPQDPDWHPEGDVFTHTCHCCDALATLPEWKASEEESRVVYMLAVLAHDFGKPATTYGTIKDGHNRIVSPGHQEVGVPITEEFLNRINAPLAIQERVVPLVANHMAHMQAVTDKAVRRLAKRLEPENIEGLCHVIAADYMGRPPKPVTFPDAVVLLKQRASQLQVNERALKPVLLGRHLLELGMQPGRSVGNILLRAYDAQIDGKFDDLEGAYKWLSDEKIELPVPVMDQLPTRAS